MADPALKDGFSLAAKIIQTFHLPTEDVLCHLAKALVLAERFSDVRDLLKLVQSSELGPESSNDKIIVSSVKVLSQVTKDVSHGYEWSLSPCTTRHQSSRHCHLV